MRNDEGDLKWGAEGGKALTGITGENVNPNGGKLYRKVYKDRVTAGKQPLFLPPSRKGVKQKRIGFGFKPSQAQRMSRGIEWLGAKYGSESLRFITLTFAREVDHEEAKKRWSTLQKRLKRRGQIDYVWCAEIQPKRLLERDEAVIHFHAVISRPISAQWLWGAWEEINGERSRVDIQRIKSSAAAYMAKYMAKEGRESERVASSVSSEDVQQMRAEGAKDKALRGQLKMARGVWESMDDDTRTYLAERMTIRGNRMGMTQNVSQALKAVKVDEVHWRDAVPSNKEERLKYANWDAERFSFLGVWGFEET